MVWSGLQLKAHENFKENYLLASSESFILSIEIRFPHQVVLNYRADLRCTLHRQVAHKWNCTHTWSLINDFNSYSPLPYILELVSNNTNNMLVFCDSQISYSNRISRTPLSFLIFVLAFCFFTDRDVNVICYFLLVFRLLVFGEDLNPYYSTNRPKYHNFFSLSPKSFHSLRLENSSFICFVPLKAVSF